MNVLFVCNQNENRSKTAEKVFATRFSTKSAGLFNKNPVKKVDLNWADLIVVMEDFQRTEISKRFPEIYMKKRIISLNIEDKYKYNDRELIQRLDSSFNELFY